MTHGPWPMTSRIGSGFTRCPPGVGLGFARGWPWVGPVAVQGGHRAQPGLVRGRQGAGTLFVMRVLVPAEGDDLDQPPAVDGVAQDEPGRDQDVEQGVDVAGTAGQDVELELDRAVLEPALSVGPAPEAGEQERGERVD